MAKYVRFIGEESQNESPFTGRGSTWWQGEVRQVSDAVANALVSSSAGWELCRPADTTDVPTIRRDASGIAQAVQVDGVDAVPIYAAQPSGDTTGQADAAAIQAALDSVHAAGGGSVSLASGVYYIGAELVLTGAADIVLCSPLSDTTLRLADNPGAALPGDMHNILRLDGCSRVKVAGIRFDGNYQNQNMANLAMAFGDAAQGGSGNRRDPFTIRYVGAGSACSAAIAGGILSTTVTGGPGSENLSLDLSATGYDTVAELVAYIDGLAAYQATLVHAGFGSQLSSRLYATTFADIKTSAVGVNFVNASNAGTHEIYGNCIVIDNSNECEVYGCDLSNAPHMGVLITGNSSRNRVVNNTGSYNNWRACEIWPNAGTASTQNVVALNVFADSYHDSIVAEFPGTYRNVVHSNCVKLTDVAFNDGEHAGIKVYNSNGNTIYGNTLLGCFISLEVAPCDYNVICGNTVDGQDRHTSIAYVTRGVYVKAGVGNVVTGNSLHDPYYDTIRIGSGASKTIVAENVLTGNDNASRYPVIIEAGSADNSVYSNVLVGNTNSYSDLGTRTRLGGLGNNGANDPASAGDWSGASEEGSIVRWTSGGKARLSMRSGGVWVNFYAEP